MGAVIANAVHDATGARVLQLPMTPDRLKSALASA
jgi:CO/xanthine dehydrogenase Mo-binding subunit